MKLIDDISLQVEVFVEDGQYKVFIAEEDSTGYTTNVKSIKDIIKALENYLSNIL